MVLLSPRFAVLACLCAALPLALPPPVKAAHLYGSHMKHASSYHSHHRSPSASPTHSYDGKHDGQHKAPHRRAPELPPLLRRHSAHDPMNAEGRQGRGPYDHAHPQKGPRSVFARSRHRGTHSRRSSVYVPGDHGDRYLVTGTPSNNRGNGRQGKRRSSRAYNRRQVDESNLVLGRVDVMGAELTNVAQRLASLMVESTPIDWTSGQSTAKAFPLNASTTNQTQFIMMPMDEPTNPGGSFMKYVTLATEVFDASSAEMVMYCATYDPDPGSTSALLMTPCTGETQPAASTNDATDPCSDDAIDASSSDSDVQQSQIFSYDPSTGKIEPISATATSSSSAVDDSSDDPVGCAGARVRRDTSNSTTSSSTTRSATSTSTAPTASASQQARNVTLVYVPGALEVPASSPSALNSTSASVGQGPVLTTTITTTVMATMTASDPSTRTVTPVQAAVSASVSSMPSLSATPSVLATPSPPSSLSSSLRTTTSKAPANPNESLQVEVVGIAPSTTTGSSLMSSTTRTTTTSYSSVSPTLNPQAVAWSIANQMAQNGAFVSAAGKVTPP